MIASTIPKKIGWKSERLEDFWTLRGTAFVCENN